MICGKYGMGNNGEVGLKAAHRCQCCDLAWGMCQRDRSVRRGVDESQLRYAVADEPRAGRQHGRLRGVRSDLGDCAKRKTGQ